MEPMRRQTGVQAQLRHKHPPGRALKRVESPPTFLLMAIKPKQFMVKRFFAWCMAASLMLPMAAHAQANLAGDGLRVSGFGTLGLTSVHGPDDTIFRRDFLQPGLDDQSASLGLDTRLGVQGNWRASQRWEFVGQVLLRRRLPQEHAEDSISWAFASYTPDPLWTIRLGRTSPDLFLLAEYRNVGFAYPWVRPSVDFYGWTHIGALDGVDATRSWTHGDTHWRAKAFVGRSHFDLDGVNGDTPVDGRRVLGMTLSREENGLTLKFSLAHALTRPADAGPLQSFRNALQAVTMLPVSSVSAEAAQLMASVPDGDFTASYRAIGLAWEHGRWVLQGELAKMGGNYGPTRATRGYASVGYRMGNAMLYSVLSAGRADAPTTPIPQWEASLAPVVGPELAAMIQQLGTQAAINNNSSREDQSSVSIGTRLDVGSNAALKLQWDTIRVRPNGGGVWRDMVPFERKVNVVSATLDFIF